MLKEKNPDNISIAEDISNTMAASKRGKLHNIQYILPRMAASKRGKLDGLTNIEAAVERLRSINWQFKFKRIVLVEQLPILFSHR